MTDQNNWQRMRFKKNKVWLALDQDGKTLRKNQKVLIKYQLDQSHEYWVHEKSVVPLEAEVPGDKVESSQKSSSLPPSESPAIQDHADAVIIYTDGASSGNPGPAGIGVVLKFGDHEKEISKYLGITTNNVAELQAIKTGLLELKKTNLPVRVYTDSTYAKGVLTQGWKARKNRALIESIRQLIAGFTDLKIIQVKGHNGLEGNERADRLATSAAQKG